MSELNGARWVRNMIQQTMDDWPDVPELNNAFNHLSYAHGVVSHWIAAHDDLPDSLEVHRTWTVEELQLAGITQEQMARLGWKPERVQAAIKSATL